MFEVNVKKKCDRGEGEEEKEGMQLKFGVLILGYWACLVVWSHSVGAGGLE